MNILVPYPWLKNHLDTPVKAEEFQRLVSLCGPSVERINQVNNEPVMDIEVTTNRMDTASIRGIAREAAVILSHSGKRAKLIEIPKYVPQTHELVNNTKQFPVNVRVSDKLCSRITAVVLSVTTSHSPAWMAQKLEQVSIRSLNNVIDVTNYVMMEIGQPTHVFDLDRLGKTLNIRESKKGETFITLDGKKHTCLGGDIVADNGKGEIVDLIGIMGTANSVVTDTTKRVLFFIEHTNPTKIRKTSMGLAIRTQAAQLNEKQLDPNIVMDALLRGIHLFQEVADAQVESSILDLYPKPVQPKRIVLPLSLTKEYLGLDIPTKTQVSILEQLGCLVHQADELLEVTVPTLRPDIEIPVDLIEEIARIYGYHNIPSVLMSTPIPTMYPVDTDFAKEYEVKEFLTGIGVQEVYTYSAVSETLAKESGYTIAEHMKLQNPLGDDHVYMRRSLIPSHRECLMQNTAYGETAVFEFANTYTPRVHNIPEETLHLTITSSNPWRIVKGYAEAVLRKLYVPEKQIHWVPMKGKQETHATLTAGNATIGSLVLLPTGHTSVDMEWKKLLAVSRKYPTYEPLPTYPPIIEDMTFCLPETVTVGQVQKTLMNIKLTQDITLSSIKVKDVYKRNITFTLQYRCSSHQLTSQELEPVRKHVVAVLKKELNCSLVGSV